jgi:hypothetical protein
MSARDPGGALREVAAELTRLDERRLQDRIDAIRLIEVNPNLDGERVRDDLRLIEQRGFHRRQDLAAKLRDVMESARSARER